MLLRDQCISITELRNNTKECLSHLDEGEKYVFVNNKPKAVIVDVDVYEKLFRPQITELDDCDISEDLKKKIQKSRKKDKSSLTNI